MSNPDNGRALDRYRNTKRAMGFFGGVALAGILATSGAADVSSTQNTNIKPIPCEGSLPSLTNKLGDIRMELASVKSTPTQKPLIECWPAINPDKKTS